MGFQLDNLSVGRLRGLHPDLVRVVQKCASDVVMPFTFGISQGLRSIEQQKQYVAQGRSQTMDSRHLDGHAVDLVVLVNNEMAWDWPFYYQLADAMKIAAVDTQVALVWGGVWDREVEKWADDAEGEHAAYVLREKALGRKPFSDGCHFELSRAKYLSGAPVAGIKTA